MDFLIAAKARINTNKDNFFTKNSFEFVHSWLKEKKLSTWDLRLFVWNMAMFPNFKVHSEVKRKTSNN